jgi:hypothetical protein
VSRSPYRDLTSTSNPTFHKHHDMECDDPNCIDHVGGVGAPPVVNPPTTSAPNPVDHPSHYGGADNTYEAIKVIAAWGLDFALGNTVKYIARAGKKDAAKLSEDLQKAAWYLAWKIGDVDPVGLRKLAAAITKMTEALK